jgi:hypothetical protein
MRRTGLLLLVPLCVTPARAADDPPAPRTLDKAKRARLLEIYRDDAAKYVMYRDAKKAEKLELRREPVYVWTNPLRSGGQDGALFVWTYRGRPEVIASIFTNPATGPRRVSHELQSLSLSVLDVSRPAPPDWTPEGPGTTLNPVPGAPKPAETPTARMVQMRALIHNFSGHTLNGNTRWDLRPLAHPLYRYESTDPDIIDGGLFAYVTSAGTDPEAILLLEARRPKDGGNVAWHYGVTRFTDMALWVNYKGTEVFTAERCVYNEPRQDSLHRYRLFEDRRIPAVEDESTTPADAAPQPQPTREVKP